MFLQDNYLNDDYEDYGLKGFKKIPGIFGKNLKFYSF